tara:strand:- start:616 stop:1290 length:675 start_codon:yes stop_codon:yes gene_type:complete
VTRFICLKQGHKYGVEYVNILHNRIRRQVSGLTEFVCYTDTPDQAFDEGITVINLPHLPQLYGWWWKCWILSQPHPGRNLYMDLDMLIVGDCDVYAPLGSGLTGLWNIRHLNSSILAWNDSLPEIFKQFETKKGFYLGSGGVMGDQEVINDTASKGNLELKYWPESYTAWLDVKTKHLARSWNGTQKTIVCKGPRNPHEHLDHKLVQLYWKPYEPFRTYIKKEV